MRATPRELRPPPFFRKILKNLNKFVLAHQVSKQSSKKRAVRDLGSRNGTFLNTLPAKNTKVHSGDEIRLVRLTHHCCTP